MFSNVSSYICANLPLKDNVEEMLISDRGLTVLDQMYLFDSPLYLLTKHNLSFIFF